MKYFAISQNGEGRQRYFRALKESWIKELDKIQFKNLSNIEVDFLFRPMKEVGDSVVYQDIGAQLLHKWTPFEYYSCVVSDSLLNTLTSLSLPEWFSIPLIVNQSDIEINESFHLFVIEFLPETQVIFGKSIFSEVDILSGKKINTYSPGFIMGMEDLKNKSKELFKSSPNSIITPQKYILKSSYDIFWGTPYNLIFSNKAYDKLSLDDIQGVHLHQFTKYDIGFEG